MEQKELKHSELTSNIIGCAMRVHTALGTGFQEVVYQRALEIEMAKNGISYNREFEMTLYYSGHVIGSRRVDFLVEGIIPVELKATSMLENVHLAQSINYLEVLNLEIGLLINFGSTSLQFKRLYNTTLTGYKTSRKQLYSKINPPTANSDSKPPVIHASDIPAIPLNPMNPGSEIPAVSLNPANPGSDTPENPVINK